MTATPVDILVVEDDKETAVRLVSLLESRGYVVEHVGTLAQAYEWLAAHPAPRVAIVDIMLPNGNGAMFVDEVKRVAPGCKVIVASGYPPRYWSDDIKGSGPDEVIAKPIKFDVLSALLPDPDPRPA